MRASPPSHTRKHVWIILILQVLYAHLYLFINTGALQWVTIYIYIYFLCVPSRCFNVLLVYVCVCLQNIIANTTCTYRTLILVAQAPHTSPCRILARIAPGSRFDRTISANICSLNASIYTNKRICTLLYILKCTYSTNMC